MIHSFTVCVDGGDDVVGIQFAVKEISDESNTVDLTPMGSMTGDCNTLRLKSASGPIEKIKASYSTDEESVTAVRFYKGDIKKSYGVLERPSVTWEFDDTNKLIGVHGRLDGDTIVQLGFVTHTTDDALCEAVYPEDTTQPDNTTGTDDTAETGEEGSSEQPADTEDNSTDTTETPDTSNGSTSTE